MAYTAIASNIVSGTSTASITFSSIPQTYKDLIIRVSVNTTTAAPSQGSLDMRIGSATGSYTYIYTSDGGPAVISAAAGIKFAECAAVDYANRFSVGEITINNYTKSTSEKRIGGTFGYYNRFSANPYMRLFTTESAGSSTNNVAAISSLTFYSQFGGNLANGSRFDLYGVS
jgi:hypothetical protein